MSFLYEQLRSAADRHGYAFYDSGEFNLNIVGIRSSSRHPEVFDDTILVAYRSGGFERVCAFPATTDPSTYYLRNPINVRGTAILPPGQYRGLWRYGRHKQTYPALVQNRAVTVWRDNNRNDRIDAAAQDHGHFGINLHRAGLSTEAEDHVHRWSAGCQVIATLDDWLRLMDLVKKSRARYGDVFSYTLYNETDL